MQFVQSLGPPRESSVRLEPGLWTLCPVLSFHKRLITGPDIAVLSTPLPHPSCSDLPPEVPTAASYCGNEFTLLREKDLGLRMKSGGEKISSNNFS